MSKLVNFWSMFLKWKRAEPLNQDGTDTCGVPSNKLQSKTEDFHRRLQGNPQVWLGLYILLSILKLLTCARAMIALTTILLEQLKSAKRSDMMTMGVQVDRDFLRPQKIWTGMTQFIIWNNFTMLKLSGIFSMMSRAYTLVNVCGWTFFPSS